MFFLIKNPTRSATTEGRLEGEVDVLLRVEAHDERGHVDHLTAHTANFYLPSKLRKEKNFMIFISIFNS